MQWQVRGGASPVKQLDSSNLAFLGFPLSLATIQKTSKTIIMKTVLNSLLCLTACSCFAVSSQGQVATSTPSRFLPGDKAIRLASGEQAAPEIAAGAGSTLAVWQDKRALGAPLAVPSFEWETSSDIYGARIAADGRMIDRIPIPIAQGKAMQLNPQVVWNGSSWLVIFESVDVNGTGFYYQDSLEAVRVSAAGVVLDPLPIKIRNIVPAGNSWTAASDGTDWFVAFQESDMSSALDLLRITPAGVVLQGPKVAVPSTYFLRSNLRLAYANGVFLFTWADFSDTKALRFDPALNLIDPIPFTLVAGNVVTDLTSDGTQFYAVWFKSVNFVSQVAGSRISTTGAVLDPGGDVISNNASAPDGFTGAFVSWDGINFRAELVSLEQSIHIASEPDGNGPRPRRHPHPRLRLRADGLDRRRFAAGCLEHFAEWGIRHPLRQRHRK